MGSNFIGCRIPSVRLWDNIPESRISFIIFPNSFLDSSFLSFLLLQRFPGSGLWVKMLVNDRPGQVCWVFFFLSNFPFEKVFIKVMSGRSEFPKLFFQDRNFHCISLLHSGSNGCLSHNLTGQVPAHAPPNVSWLRPLWTEIFSGQKLNQQLWQEGSYWSSPSSCTSKRLLVMGVQPVNS